MEEAPLPDAEPLPDAPVVETVSPGESMEIHPPHGSIHSLKDFFLQLATITAGVLIALLLEGLVEWNHNRGLVHEARTTIGREIGR
jgi:hypothetical protein